MNELLSGVGKAVGKVERVEASTTVSHTITLAVRLDKSLTDQKHRAPKFIFSYIGFALSFEYRDTTRRIHELVLG